MKDSLGFAILGSGMIAPFHARAIQAAPGARLVGFASRSPASARERASEFGVRAWDSLDALLADPEVDVVNIATPNHVHVDPVLRCAMAGKHVIVEKPPALSLRETDAMIDACREAGVKITCMVNCRMREAVRWMRSAADKGRFGHMLQADTYMKWFRSEDYYQSNPWRSDQRLGAGVTIQQGFHYIDLLQHLAGPVRRVEAQMTNLAHPAVDLEDTVAAFLEYESGARGIVQASTALWPGTDVRIELNGTGGTAIMQGEVLRTWRFRKEDPADAGADKVGSAAQVTASGGPASLGFAEHQRVVEDMIASIRDNRAPSITLESVRHTLEICLALYLSARTSKPVTLPLQDESQVWG